MVSVQEAGVESELSTYSVRGDGAIGDSPRDDAGGQTGQTLDGGRKHQLIG